MGPEPLTSELGQTHEHTDNDQDGEDDRDDRHDRNLCGRPVSSSLSSDNLLNHYEGNRTDQTSNQSVNNRLYHDVTPFSKISGY